MNILLIPGTCRWRTWVHQEKYIVTIPDGTLTGQYDLILKLYSNDENKDVLSALDPDLSDEENYYKITAVQVTKVKTK